MQTVGERRTRNAYRRSFVRAAASVVGASAVGWLGCASHPTETTSAENDALFGSSLAETRSLVWRDLNTGSVAYWDVSGAKRIGSGELQPVADPSWHLETTGDFNGDSYPDYAWRNTTTGDNVIWYMKYGGVSYSRHLKPVGDPGWRIYGATDLNNDGNDDLVWRNNASGQNSIWFVNGNGVAGTTPFEPVGDPNWHIEAAASSGTPYPGGGTYPEIFWRNVATGEVAMWFMSKENSSHRVTSFHLPTLPLQYSISGAADLNQDGHADLLLRNHATGGVDEWFLNGAQLIAALNLMPSVPANWQLVGASKPVHADGACGLVDTCRVLKQCPGKLTGWAQPSVPADLSGSCKCVCPTESSQNAAPSQAAQMKACVDAVKGTHNVDAPECAGFNKINVGDEAEDTDKTKGTPRPYRSRGQCYGWGTTLNGTLYFAWGNRWGYSGVGFDESDSRAKYNTYEAVFDRLASVGAGANAKLNCFIAFRYHVE